MPLQPHMGSVSAHLLLFGELTDLPLIDTRPKLVSHNSSYKGR